MSDDKNRNTGNTNEASRESGGISKTTSLLVLIFFGLAIVFQSLYYYYVENPMKFPWGKSVHTVQTEDLNLLPNEQINYLGTRASEDSDSEFVYRARSMNLKAAAAFSIRTGPGIYYQSIGRMYYGRDVHVIGVCEDSDWYMIDFYEGTAYVHSACLFEKLPEKADEPYDSDEALLDEITAYISTRTTEQTSDPEIETEPQDPAGPSVIETQPDETAAALPTEAAATATPSPTQVPAPTEQSAAPAETQAPVPAVTGGPSDPTLLELFNLVNDARAQNGLNPLSWSETLAADAAVRSREISVSFSHTRPDGSDWWTCDSAHMYGENIASGQSSAQEVFNSWWASPGHKANILRADFTSCGFALYYGADAGSTYYWVQEFGY